MSTTRVQLIDKNTTVGTAAAEDTKIVFDGNAQDFHIGIDDSTDSLTLGLGTALGTTSHARFDPIGAVLMPLQPAFRAYLGNNNMTDISTGNTDVVFAGEIIDQNGDYNTSNYTFTAPVTGQYFFSCTMELSNVDSSNDYMRLAVVTSNRTIYQGIWSPDKTFASDGGYCSLHTSGLFDMDASDTCKMQIQINTGSAQTDTLGQANCTFTGFLVC